MVQVGQEPPSNKTSFNRPPVQRLPPLTDKGAPVTMKSIKDHIQLAYLSYNHPPLKLKSDFNLFDFIEYRPPQPHFDTHFIDLL